MALDLASVAARASSQPLALGVRGMAVGTARMSLDLAGPSGGLLFLVAVTAAVCRNSPSVGSMAVGASLVSERHPDPCLAVLAAAAVALGAGLGRFAGGCVRGVAACAIAMACRRGALTEIHAVTAVTRARSRTASTGVAVQPVTEVASGLRVQGIGSDDLGGGLMVTTGLGLGVALGAGGNDRCALVCAVAPKAMAADADAGAGHIRVAVPAMREIAVAAEAGLVGDRPAMHTAAVAAEAGDRRSALLVLAVSWTGRGQLPTAVLEPVVAAVAGSLDHPAVTGDAETRR
jgi:hypothetical protein